MKSYAKSVPARTRAAGFVGAAAGFTLGLLAFLNEFSPIRYVAWGLALLTVATYTLSALLIARCAARGGEEGLRRVEVSVLATYLFAGALIGCVGSSVVARVMPHRDIPPGVQAQLSVPEGAYAQFLVVKNATGDDLTLTVKVAAGSEWIGMRSPAQPCLLEGSVPLGLNGCLLEGDGGFVRRVLEPSDSTIEDGVARFSLGVANGAEIDIETVLARRSGKLVVGWQLAGGVDTCERESAESGGYVFVVDCRVDGWGSPTVTISRP